MKRMLSVYCFMKLRPFLDSTCSQHCVKEGESLGELWPYLQSLFVVARVIFSPTTVDWGCLVQWLRYRRNPTGLVVWFLSRMAMHVRVFSFKTKAISFFRLLWNIFFRWIFLKACHRQHGFHIKKRKGKTMEIHFEQWKADGWENEKETKLGKQIHSANNFQRKQLLFTTF